MELLGVKDVMALLKVGRPTATRIIKDSGRMVRNGKAGKMLITKEALRRYLEEKK